LLVTQITYQPIAWQQLNAFRHLNVKQLAEVQTEHQNGEEREVSENYVTFECGMVGGVKKLLINSDFQVQPS